MRRLLETGQTLAARVYRRLFAPSLVVRRDRYLPSKAYVDAFGGRWHEVFPPGSPERVPPVAFGRQRVDFASMLDPVPALGVLELEGAGVTPHGWIVSREGHLLPEHSMYGLGLPDRLKRPELRLELTRLRGVCLSLASDWAYLNYGHFLLDGLCRFELFSRAGFSVSDVDHVYCAYPAARAARFLARLGIPREKIVRAARGTAVRADVLLAPSFPGTLSNYQRWAVDFLRRSVGPERATPAGRRLYLPRTTSRRVLNEARLLPILEEHGFEILDPARAEDPPRDFAEAEVVVGAHGASLADLAFCAPGTRVLELLPSDHIAPYWYTLSEAAGLRYAYLIGESTVERPPGSKGPSPHDFVVDEAAFREALAGTMAL